MDEISKKSKDSKTSEVLETLLNLRNFSKALRYVFLFELLIILILMPNLLYGHTNLSHSSTIMLVFASVMGLIGGLSYLHNMQNFTTKIADDGCPREMLELIAYEKDGQWIPTYNIGRFMKEGAVWVILAALCELITLIVMRSDSALILRITLNRPIALAVGDALKVALGVCFVITSCITLTGRASIEKVSHLIDSKEGQKKAQFFVMQHDIQEDNEVVSFIGPLICEFNKDGNPSSSRQLKAMKEALTNATEGDVCLILDDLDRGVIQIVSTQAVYHEELIRTQRKIQELLDRLVLDLTMPKWSKESNSSIREKQTRTRVLSPSGYMESEELEEEPELEELEEYPI